MSLINQMLKDLDSRRNPELPVGTVLPGSRAITSPGRRSLTLILGLLVTLLALGLGYLLWQQQTSPQRETTVATVAPPAPGAAPKVTPNAEVVTPSPPPASVIAPRQPTLVQKAPAVKVAAIGSRLTSITPSVMDGGTEPRTLTLKGDGLNNDHRIIVSWDSKEKLLPADRVEWLDARTVRIKVTTGNSDTQWQVALLRPDGSRSETVEFEVIASPYADSHSIDSADSGQMKKIIHPPTTTEQADQLYQQGYRALQQRNSASAEQLWQQALTTEPTHLKSREGLIALYLSQGRKIESAKLLEEGVKIHPEYAQFSLLHARLLVDQGDTAAAITALEQAMGHSEPQPDLFALAAALYQQQHNYDKSIQAYQRALQMQPQQSHWWMGIGISLEGAGKPTEAKSAYEEALQRGALTKESRQYVEQRLSALR
jgi:Tfp pilus assembly protein PilF